MTFQPGESGNPKGRPRGARNKATLIAEQLLDGEVEAITRKAIELATHGEQTALRLCLERLVPARRERLVSFALPALNTPADAVAAAAAIAAAVAAGEMSTSEAGELSKLVESFANIMAAADLAERVTRLESGGKK